MQKSALQDIASIPDKKKETGEQREQLKQNSSFKLLWDLERQEVFVG